MNSLKRCSITDSGEEYLLEVVLGYSFEFPTKMFADVVAVTEL